MKTTSSVSFVCRASKKDKKGFSPVEMGINLNGERVYLNLPTKCQPELFSKKKQPKEIIELQDAWRLKVLQIQTQMLLNGIPLTASNIKQLLQTGGVPTYTLKKLEQDYLYDLKHRDVECGVYRKYELVYDRLVEELGDIEVKQITNGQLSSFYGHLTSQYKPQTSAAMFQKVRSLFRYAMNNGKIQVNVAEGIKTTKGKNEIVYLEEEELVQLANTDFNNESLNKVRDIFALMAYTGLAYCDCQSLKVEDIKEEDGIKYISGRRHKTGTPFTAVIIGDVQTIIERNGGIPKMSNQKINAYLKVIGDLIGLEKSLHCHLARKTYCTMLLNRGIRLEVVAKCAGHSNTKITAAYYAQLQKNTVLKEVSLAFS